MDAESPDILGEPGQVRIFAPEPQLTGHGEFLDSGANLRHECNLSANLLGNHEQVVDTWTWVGIESETTEPDLGDYPDFDPVRKTPSTPAFGTPFRWRVDTDLPHKQGEFMWVQVKLKIWNDHFKRNYFYHYALRDQQVVMPNTKWATDESNTYFDPSEAPPN